MFTYHRKYAFLEILDFFSFGRLVDRFKRLFDNFDRFLFSHFFLRFLLGFTFALPAEVGAVHTQHLTAITRGESNGSAPPVPTTAIGSHA